MGCPSNTMKIILYIVNTILLIFGVAVLALAIICLKVFPSLFIVYLFYTGSLALLIAIIGCCGICKESIPLTKAYAAILLISIIAQLFGKFVLSSPEKARNIAVNNVEEQWAREIHNPGAMDAIQVLHDCCGKNSAQDYVLIGHEIPETCYSKLEVKLDDLYTTGCIDATKEYVKELYSRTSFGEWSYLIFTLIMFFFACYLVKRFTRKQQRYNYH